MNRPPMGGGRQPVGFGTPLRVGGATASALDDVEEELDQYRYLTKSKLIPVFVTSQAYDVPEVQVGRLVDDDDEVNI